MSLGAAGILTQEPELGETMLVHAFIGFNKLTRLEMLWTVLYIWPAGARFAFNCYKHWA